MCAGCGRATRCSASARARSPSTRARQADKVVPKPASLTFEQAAAVPMAGDDGPARDPGRGRGAGRAPGARQRGRRRGRHLRRADRGGAGRGGHRSVQHAQRRAGALDRRRARRRLHDGGLHRRARALRRDPRQRGQPAAAPAAPGTRPRPGPSCSTAAAHPATCSGRLAPSCGRSWSTVSSEQRLRLLPHRTEPSDQLLAVTGLIEAGKLTPVVDRTYPLADTAEGLRRVEQGHARGKVVITVP